MESGKEKQKKQTDRSRVRILHAGNGAGGALCGRKKRPFAQSGELVTCKACLKQIPIFRQYIAAAVLAALTAAQRAPEKYKEGAGRFATVVRRFAHLVTDWHPMASTDFERAMNDPMRRAYIANIRDSDAAFQRECQSLASLRFRPGNMDLGLAKYEANELENLQVTVTGVVEACNPFCAVTDADVMARFVAEQLRTEMQKNLRAEIGDLSARLTRLEQTKPVDLHRALHDAMTDLRKAGVVRLCWNAGRDHIDQAAFFCRILLNNVVLGTNHEHLRTVVAACEEILRAAFGGAGLSEAIVYYNYRTVAEQEKLKDPEWEGGLE